MLKFFNRLGNEIKVKMRYYFTLIGLSKIKKNENAITVSNAGKSVLSYMAGEISVTAFLESNLTISIKILNAFSLT